MSRSPITVCITGAAGQISYSLLPLLASGLVFGPDQPLHLHLLEIAPALPALSGVVMELADGTYPLLKSVIPTADMRVAFTGAQVAVLVGAFPRRKGMERKDLLAKNVEIFKKQGQMLNEVGDKDVKVLVVGNPANTNAMTFSRFAPRLDPKNITALTRLDHNRAVAQIASRLGCSAEDVEGVCVWGNHSSTQYPDVMRATVAGKSVLAKLGGSEGVAEGLIAVVQKRGASIIEARGMSSAMSAAKAIGDHLRSWICGDKRVVSMAVKTDGKTYGIKEGVWFSFPVKCLGDGAYEIVTDLELCEFSQAYLKITAEELYAEKEEAEALLD